MAESSESLTLTKRYTHAYLVSRATVGFAELIKFIGTLLAILILIGTIIISGEARGEAAVLLFISGTVCATFTGLLLYFLGILISVQGQILMASLDYAVNSSPFLNNDQRAKIMLLQRTSNMSGTASAEEKSISNEYTMANGTPGTCEICGKPPGFFAKFNSAATRCREHPGS